MAITKYTIANRALLKIRSQTLETFEDETLQSNIVNQIYESFIQNLLECSDWKFATKKQQISKSTSTPINQWSYIYTLPADFLKLIAVWDSSSTYILSTRDFKLFEKNTLYSNTDGLWIDYIYRIDESYWPYYFIEFVISALASELAIPISGDSNLAQLYALQAYGSPSENGQGGLFGKASFQDARQNPNPILRLNYFSKSRFGLYEDYDNWPY